MTDAEAQQRVALVTGASGGIGRAVALGLARDGFAVVLHYAGNAAPAESAVDEIKAAGGEAFAVKADVADAAAVERLFQETLGAFGRIDVVVNSAGVMPLGPIADGALDAFDRVIATNLRGAFLVLSQAAGTSLRAAASSRSRAASSPSRCPATARTSPRRPAWKDWSACWPTSCAAAGSRSTRSRPARWRPSCS